MPDSEAQEPSSVAPPVAPADDRIEGILESITDAFVIVDREWRITTLNRRAGEIGAALTGSDAPLIGRVLWDAVPEFKGMRIEFALRRAMEEQVRVELEHRYTFNTLEVWFEVRANPVGEGISIVLHEITMRKATQDALRESANRLQLALDGGHLVDWKWDAAKDALSYGPRAGEWLGLPDSEPVTRMQWREFVHPDDRERAREAMDRALQHQTRYDVEYRIIPPDGVERWVAVKGQGVYGENGQVLGMYGVAQEITEKKRAEEAQRRSERDLRALADSIPQLAFIADRDGHVIWYNRGWYAYTGTTFEEMERGGWQTVHKPEIRRLVLERWKESLARGSAFDMEFPLRGGDGAFRWFLTRVNPLRDADGSVTRWFGTSTDVDQVKRAQEALRDESRLLELVNRIGTTLGSKLDLRSLMQTLTDAATELASARYGAYVTSVSSVRVSGSGSVSGNGQASGADDPSKLYVLSGEAHASLAAFGLPNGIALFEPLLRGDSADIVVRCDDVQSHPTYGTMAAQWTMPPGHLPVKSFLAVPVTSRAGPVLGVLLFGHPEPRVFSPRSERLIVGIAAQAAVAIDNATLFEAAKASAAERAWLLDSERMARAEAERLSAIKDEFLATVSHELRSPLSAILGWSHVLRKHASGAAHESELLKGLETIERNARAQAQLIEDLLDMSRITSGKVRLDMQPVEPATFVEAALETIRPSALAKGVALELEIDPSIGTIEGDPNRLQQVIGNLLANAIKFTGNDGNGGSIRVSLTRSDSEIAISVADTGVGIKPDFLPQMFERFRQADATTTRRYGGLGLGLAIVRHLVELHRGRVEAKSDGEGKGSTFIVRLPAAAACPPRYEHARRSGDPQAPASYRMTDLSGTRVIVVDDDTDIRELVARILGDCTAVVTTAGNAAEALAIVERERPDVLISDIGMPDADGYELLRRVRALGADKGGRVPAIALTAFARSEDRTRALLAGFIAHVAKPVDPSELVATVASVAGRAGYAQ